MTQRPTESTGDRLVSIDIWRGISIMFTISSHLFFGLYGGDLFSVADLTDPFMLLFGIFSTTGQMFFFLSGCSQIISIEKSIERGIPVNAIIKSSIKKGIFLIVIGMVYDVVVYWHFGIVDTLHIIGLSYIIIPLLYRPVMKKKIPSDTHDPARLRKAGSWFLLGTVAVVATAPLVRMLVGYPIHDPSIELLVYALPPQNLIEWLQAWATTSFFPIVPWIAYFFSGAWFGTRIINAIKKGEAAKRKLAIRSVWVGLVIMIVGTSFVFVGEELAGDLIYLPQYLQPNWVVELSFNFQPLTTSVFILYFGMNLAGVGFFSFIYEIKHRESRQARLVKAHYWLKLDLVFNTWVRYSYYSLSIYILQYAWIPVLRVLQLATGMPILYTMTDTLLITVIIIVAWILFAFLAKWFNTKQGNRFTFERLLKKIK